MKELEKIGKNTFYYFIIFNPTNMKTTSFDDLLDKFIGLPGTSKRNAFDQE